MRRIGGSTTSACLRSNVGVKPMRARYKIYIIDEVHMLTNEAFNALLKTLEEPPPNVKFIFCTTEPNKVPDTILSRCQRFDFAAIATQQIVERLHEIADGRGLPGRAGGVGARRPPGRRLDARQPIAVRPASGLWRASRSPPRTSTGCWGPPATSG